ncbi:hypothetical protein DTL70_32785 [Streptomyces diacarni]|uniref:Uncharacterized protein n=1 Tax=Streptomyces diacarni TaxID=2800381 RepID=A0A367E7M0_9ACTN|nr:hypothetical protein [Streptomyces diacarni]RCG14011.1 hypothetical protein DTL70_32785 [Streptomyces diacarni]
MDHAPPPPPDGHRTPPQPHLPPLPSTEAAVEVLSALAERRGLPVAVEHAIGADESSRRTAAGAFAVTDADGSLPHEALVEIPATDGPGGAPRTPRIAVQLFEEGDAHITVDGVTFHDLPRESAPAFLEAVFDGRAHLRTTWYPPFCRLVVTLDGELSYKEVVPLAYGGLSRWLNSLRS